MKKLIFFLMAFLFLECHAQKVTDYKGITAPDFSGTPKRIDVDSSKWNLYKIDSGYYFYYKLFSYGLQWPSGWSDLVGYMDRTYLKDTYLYFDCMVTDTIPTVMHIQSYDEEKKMFKSYDEYRVGGMFGEFVRYGNVVYTKD